jgi:phospholipid/cholesterol/gamma-HCH transport system substrate-binding protein
MAESSRAKSERSEQREEEASPARRVITALAILAVAAVAAYALFFNGDEYEVTAHFQNASQLVEGNEVLVGGVGVGSIDKIELGDQNEAEVTFTVSDDYAPLRRGTVATVRSGSLSSIAGRQIQLTLPPSEEAGEEIPSGGELSQKETVSAVDLDEIFNTLTPKTVRDFKHVIQGFDTSYDAVSEQANRGYHYLNPFLSTSRRLFDELTFDTPALERLLVDTSNLSGALSDRSPELTALIEGLSRMMGALGSEREALTASIRKLPAFMSASNTTFAELRSTLDDVDPLVEASKPVAEKLGPFFKEFRAAAADAVPTVNDLDALVRRGGADNDLVELSKAAVRLAEVGAGTGAPDCGTDPTTEFAAAADDDFTQGALGESACALQNSLPALSFFRSYTPELTGWFNDFGPWSGYFDANGGVVRIGTTFNVFSASLPGFPNILGLPGNLFDNPLLDTNNLQKCPGANERPAPDGSNPFTDGGTLPCDPTQTPPGP